MLSLLATSPMRPTDLAKHLKVSKATVSYHLKELSRRGVVETTDVRSLKGSVYSKTVRLRPGGVVIAGYSETKPLMGSPLEAIEKLKMNWGFLRSEGRVNELKLVLFQLFVAMHNTAPQSRLPRFREYGFQVGTMLVSKEVAGGSLRRISGQTSRYLSSSGIASCSSEERESGSIGIQCLACLGSRDYGGPVCSFTEGLLGGVLASKRGRRYSVERQLESGMGCHFEIKRNRLKDAESA